MKKIYLLFITIASISICCNSNKRQSEQVKEVNNEYCSICDSLAPIPDDKQLSFDTVVNIARHRIDILKRQREKNLTLFNKFNTDTLVSYPVFRNSASSGSKFAYYFNSNLELSYIDVQSTCYEIILSSFDTLGYRFYFPLSFGHHQYKSTIPNYFKGVFVTKKGWNNLLFIGFYNEINKESISTIMSVSDDFKGCSQIWYGRQKSKPRHNGRTTLFVYKKNEFSHEHEASKKLRLDDFYSVPDILNQLNSLTKGSDTLQYRPAYAEECISQGYLWLYCGTVFY